MQTKCVRLVKKLKNRIIQLLDNGDYLSDIVWASKGMGGEGE